MGQKIQRLAVLTAALLFVAGALILYSVDNKYNTAVPAGKGNVLWDGTLGFLVDGWSIGTDNTEVHTFIGEYANFTPLSGSPFGEQEYRITITNTAEPQYMSLWLPEMMCASRVWADDSLLLENGLLSPYSPMVRDGVVSFWIEDEAHIVVETANYSHYYSGIYYPPAVGNPQDIAAMVQRYSMIRGLLCFATLAVALSQTALWLSGRRKDRLYLYMGLLCLSFGMESGIPLLRIQGVANPGLFYAAADTAASMILLFAVLTVSDAAGTGVRKRAEKILVFAASMLCAVCALFPAAILPHAPALINLYGKAVSWWKLLTAAGLILYVIHAHRRRGYQGYLLAGSTMYGAGLLLSVLTINRFEPAAGVWPEEYGTIAMVVVFALMMTDRGRRMAEENERLTTNLEAEVAGRTRDMEILIQERKNLLAELVHDIKTPLAAVRNYAELVSQGDVELDADTRSYLETLTQRVDTVADRFEQLRAFSKEEREQEKPEMMELNAWLAAFYRRNRLDMELVCRKFTYKAAKEPIVVCWDKEMLARVMENLCYNALAFTPKEGSITLTLDRQERYARIRIQDTGCGISSDDLPHIFERDFTRRIGGEGIGLYTVRALVLKNGGNITAETLCGGGALFTVLLPVSNVTGQ